MPLGSCLTLKNAKNALAVPARSLHLSYAGRTFLIPSVLVGRDKEVEVLMKAFDRIREKAVAASSPSGIKPGAVEMVMVSGEPGIGKSSLLNELFKPITSNKSNFITGKYEKYRSDAPYSAIISGLRGFIRRFLAEDLEQTINLADFALHMAKENGRNQAMRIDVDPHKRMDASFKHYLYNLSKNLVLNPCLSHPVGNRPNSRCPLFAIKTRTSAQCA